MKYSLGDSGNTVRIFLTILVIAVATAAAWYSQQPAQTKDFIANTPVPMNDTPATDALEISDTKNPVMVSVVPTDNQANSYQLIVDPGEYSLSGIQLKFTIEGTASITTKQSNTSKNGWQTAVNSTTVTNNKTTVELSYRTKSFNSMPTGPLSIATITLQKNTNSGSLPIHLDSSKSKVFTTDGSEVPLTLTF